MAEKQLQALRLLLERAGPKRDRGAVVECKHFFSGAAAYADGRIFASLTPVGFALKLPAEACAALTERGATPLRYFPKAPIKKDYVVLPKGLADDDDALAPWIDESIRLAQTFPKPRKRKARAKGA